MGSSIKGRDPVSQLYRAVERYVRSHKGSVAVIGGIEVQQWRDELSHNFRIAIKCTGKLPAIAKATGEEPNA